MQAQGQVRILRQGVGADATGGTDRLPAEGAHRPGDHGDAVPLIVGPAVEVETAGVFQGLEAAEEALQIPHPRPAGDGPHPGIGEGPHQLGDGVGLELGVGIQADDDAVADLLQAAAQGPRLAAVGLPQQADAAILPG